MRTMRATGTVSERRAILTVGLVAMAAYVLVSGSLSGSHAYNVWAALILAPALVFVSLPILHREAARQDVPGLFRLLVTALLLKLAFSLVRYYVDFTVYKGVADATGYYGHGLAYAAQIRHGGFHLPHPLVGTGFVQVLAGLVLAIIGPTKLGGFLFFAWLGFWGLFLFHRAFTVAMPEARIRAYVIPLFFMPTLLFWPSEMGKEAWMILSLGVAALGGAHVLTARTWRGISLLALGLSMAALIRPPIAGLMGVAVAIAYLVKKPRPELRQLAPLAKVAGLAAAFLLAVIMVKQSHGFLVQNGISFNKGVGSALTQIGDRTAGGGGSFIPSVFHSPLHAPGAILTVLFRPLLNDAHSGLAAASALEGTILLLYSLFRLPWFWAGLKSSRRQPYFLLALAFTLMFVVSFSGLTNFGTLVRERSQLYPLYLVLLSVPPVHHRLRRRVSSRIEAPAERARVRAAPGARRF